LGEDHPIVDVGPLIPAFIGYQVAGWIRDRH
jgi:hypothetical protein